MAEFNINHEVGIKLTERGREILSKMEYPIISQKVGEDGWVRVQLWVLMQCLGEHMGHGFDPPFETTIDIPEAK